MRVRLLLPDIHDLPTGGNIYNRRLVEEGPGDLPIETTVWDPETDPRPSFDLQGDALVVDSLLTQHPTALQTLRAAHPSVPFVLLGHYLHCIDPAEQDAEAATAERTLLEDTFDGVVTTSQYARRALVDQGVPGPCIRVVPPGLDDAYRGPPSPLAGPPTPHLLTVASLLPGKGVLPFIDVLESLSTVPWRWTLVGDASLDPAYAQMVRERVHSAGVAERVHYAGAVPTATLCTWYDRADVFVLPSRFETCSMATREAMARGLPVVGYEVGGLPENLGDAPAGHLVPPGEPQALRAALRTLLLDPMARAHRGRAARRRSHAFPTWPESAARFRAVLKNLQAKSESPETNREAGG